VRKIENEMKGSGKRNEKKKQKEAICLVHSHGIKINRSSEEKRGTTVGVILVPAEAA